MESDPLAITPPEFMRWPWPGNSFAARPSSLALVNGSFPPVIQASFHDQFVALFNPQYRMVFRLLDRLSGDPDLAADLAQEALARLYRRGELPEVPGAWLAAVAMNLFRNDRSSRSRRLRLMTPARGEAAHSDPPPSPAHQVESEESRLRVRQAIDQMTARERSMLLLRAEGLSYAEIASTLGLNEGSIGTLLARARRDFRRIYEAPSDAS